MTISSNTVAQDQITRSDGTTLECKIISIDSSKIGLIISNSGNKINTYLDIGRVSSFRYNNNWYNLNEIDKNELNTIMKNKYFYSTEYHLYDSIERLNNNYIYTYKNDIIYGRIIEFEEPFIGFPIYMLVDSEKYSLNEIKFYKNETGFHANTKNTGISNSSNFIERMRKGKINLYERTSNYNPGYFNSSTGTYSGGLGTVSIINYYNIGFGDLKKANYQNLTIDLADNPESLIYLEKYKSIKDKQKLLYIVGGAAIIGGFATLINKTKDWDGTDSEPEPNVTGNIVVIGIGAGCFWVSYFMSFSKPKYLRKAIDEYNK